MLNDLKLNLGPKGKGKGVWPGNPFLQKIKPVDAVEKIYDHPILFIHGAEDWLIKPAHSEKLFRSAKTKAELKIMSNAGHAEKIFDAYPSEFEQVCIDWFQKTIAR